MPLTEEQRTKLFAWVSRRGKNAKCLFCDANDWAAGDIVSALGYDKGALSVGGRQMPMVQLVCKNCGYVYHFAAKPILDL